MGSRTNLKRLVAWFRDLHRFQCFDQDSPAWDERAYAAVKLCLHHIPQNIADDRPLIVADLGCGNRRLERVLGTQLARSYEYRGYDLHPQSKLTVRIDLQNHVPPGPVDVVFVLGVIEYLIDVPAFLKRLSRFGSAAVVSYAVFDSPEPLSPAERQERGWRSHYSRDQFEALLIAAGWRIDDRILVNRDRTVLWMARLSAL